MDVVEVVVVVTKFAEFGALKLTFCFAIRVPLMVAAVISGAPALVSPWKKATDEELASIVTVVVAVPAYVAAKTGTFFESEERLITMSLVAMTALPNLSWNCKVMGPTVARLGFVAAPLACAEMNASVEPAAAVTVAVCEADRSPVRAVIVGVPAVRSP
ncbi:hypothetical protein [Mycetocola sp. 2940]|uniref:hypothetical protein n=1 Tax=Mycetocola sp. 2940 TaxID=3156452 RepID=UPI00339601E4